MTSVPFQRVIDALTAVGQERKDGPLTETAVRSLVRQALHLGEDWEAEAVLDALEETALELAPGSGVSPVRLAIVLAAEVGERIGYERSMEGARA